MYQSTHRKVKAMQALVAVVMALVISLCACFNLVGAGEVGVKVVFGSVSPTPLMPGIHLAPPFSVKTISTRTNVVEQKIDHIKTQGGIDMVLDDLYTYSINPVAAPDLYSKYSPFEPSVIAKAELEKTVTSVALETLAQYSVDQLNQKQDEVARLISDAVQANFADGAIKLQSFIISGFDFPDAVQESINAKQVATQLQQSAQIKQDTARIDAETNTILSKSLTDQILIKQGIDVCATTRTCALVPSPGGYGVSPILK
ncbi:MAG: SPFH domain-containing protein [Patescibacteria group bacterium]